MAEETAVDVAPFGRLQYGAEYWRGSTTLSSFEQPFALIVRAGRIGPSPQQIAAMTSLMTNAAAIKRQATEPMAELHRESGLPFPEMDAGNDKVWSILQPEEIEVSDDFYYRDGRIAALLIFGSKLEPDFAPAIETANGDFKQILSGS